jgi:transglutaminase-like putative cysteine protease
MRWVEQRIGAGMDPYRATTAIGEVGRLKASNRIRVRVYATAALQPPLLLRTASYDRYVGGTWFSSGSLSEPVPISKGEHVIANAGAAGGADAPESGAPAQSLRILLQLDRPEGLLPLPPGAQRLQGLRRAELHRNDFGAIRYRIRSGPAELPYRVLSAAGETNAPPDEADLRIIGPEQRAVETVARQLALDGLSADAAARRIARFFAEEFRYTLDLPRPAPGRSPLGRFLLQTKAGHCEYFASAAVMLLRQAGVPARYAIGWSVQEESWLERAWIARDSHAHAWVLAWIDGAWQDIDPTPPDWGALEAAERPGTVAVSDFIAWLRLALSGAGHENRGDRHWLLIPLAALVVLLAWRVVRRARRGARTPAEPGAAAAAGATALAPLEQAAARNGLGRRADETPLEWARRIAAQHPAGTELADAVALYYRERFDPRGLDADATARLRALLARCLRRWRP